MTIKNGDPAFEAGYQFVEGKVEQADGFHGSAPWWYGWMAREAFWAGVEWEREQEQPKKDEAERLQAENESLRRELKEIKADVEEHVHHNDPHSVSTEFDWTTALIAIRHWQEEAADNHRLRAIVEPLEELRQSPGASIEMFLDVDVDFVVDDTTLSAVLVSDDWTRWRRVRFEGENLAAALANALKAREAARKGQEK